MHIRAVMDAMAPGLITELPSEPSGCERFETAIPGRIRTCNTRFRNGSSVADCVYSLTCCFVSVVGDRTRSHFASVSRSTRMIEVEPGCTMRLVSSTERDTNGRVPGPPPFPRPGCLARRVVGVNGGACAIAARRRQAPLTRAMRRGRFSTEGAATQTR
jgi:hypothetical protein